MFFADLEVALAAPRQAAVERLREAFELEHVHDRGAGRRRARGPEAMCTGGGRSRSPSVQQRPLLHQRAGRRPSSPASAPSGGRCAGRPGRACRSGARAAARAGTSPTRSAGSATTWAPRVRGTRTSGSCRRPRSSAPRTRRSPSPPASRAADRPRSASSRSRQRDISASIDGLAHVLAEVQQHPHRAPRSPSVRTGPAQPLRAGGPVARPRGGCARSAATSATASASAALVAPGTDLERPDGVTEIVQDVGDLEGVQRAEPEQQGEA